MSDPPEPRVTRRRQLEIDADLVGIAQPDPTASSENAPPTSPDFFSTAPSLNIPPPPPTMTSANTNQSAANTVQNPPVLQPSFRITRFDGTGSLHINRLIRDVEDFIKSAHPACTEDERGPLCLQHVSSRLDTSNARVRDILTGLEAEPVVTWEGFKERFREAFAPTPRPPYIELARLLSQKPPLTSNTDMMSHLGRAQEALKKTLVAMEDGAAPRWKALATFIRANYVDSLTFLLLTNYTMHLSHPLQEAMASKLWATPPPTNLSFLPRYFVERYTEVASVPTAPNLSIQTAQRQGPNTRNRDPPTAGRREEKNRDPRAAGNGDWTPQWGVCFRCLREGHAAAQCRSRPHCPFHSRDGHSWDQCRTFPQRVKRTWEIIRQRKQTRANPRPNPVNFLGQQSAQNQTAGRGWQSSTS